MKRLTVTPRMRANIATSIKIARLNAGLTSAELGKLVGVSLTTISTWETMKYTPTEKNLIAVAKATGVSPHSLMNGSLVVRSKGVIRGAELPEVKSDAPKAETLCEIVNRMCNACVCDNCIVGSKRGEKERICVLLRKGVDIEADIAAVRAWAAENPPKPVRTYRDDFTEKYPNAPLREDGSPVLNVLNVYWDVSNARLDEFLEMTPAKQWNKPLGYWAEG